MSYDPAIEATREDVVHMIAAALIERWFGVRDWYEMADQILQRIERQARGETEDAE